MEKMDLGVILGPQRPKIGVRLINTGDFLYLIYLSSETHMKSACRNSPPPPRTNYLQEADVVLHVGQPAQIRAPRAQLGHLLLQPLDPPLHLAAQGRLVGAEEPADLGAGDVHPVDQLGEQIGALSLRSLDQRLARRRRDGEGREKVRRSGRTGRTRM